MNIIISVIAIFILAIGIFQQRSNLSVKKSNKKDSAKGAVLSQTSSSSATATNVAPTTTTTPSPTPALSSTVKVEIHNQVNNSSTTTSKQGVLTIKVSGNNVNNFHYPNSSTTSSSDNSLTLQTNDNANTVTDWYKNQLKNLHYNVNSFVTTNSNGVVENKLVSANGSNQISVEITNKQ